MNTTTANGPVFFYNGIKDAKGAKLQKAHYSMGGYASLPEGTITIYGKNYKHFSGVVADAFAVENNTDSQTDYFENDRIRVLPAHPLYAEVLAAYNAQQAKRAR